ncbi:cobalt ECF transporter T component CbiQ [Chroococcidiopsis sp. CCALA 051]|uniref:cobalt ECF transporter T component CbiQ n=1 Tax=Chroococcidiopsis sp. CCALA 051 TaxID=869949 RepID=UPI000D0D4F36|nr:cobalt ECF transporter T component CbiQ [Chroococcidiopsis sp. CCALA 051]MBE9015090.1 cobalt ECF transporter T component CbiQ [Chroococcidiopsidales cyanobacterium LEGE 13417]PSM49347.1 cobalt ECF transporter T component CbiQ [Chroococcidiopsis sp. CCALA 051]
MTLLHIGAFQLDIDSHKNTVWHALAPRTRILCVLLMVFAIVLTPNGHWWTWGIYGIAVISLLFLTRITLPVLLKRIAVELSFVSVVVLGTLFRDGGEVIWTWGFLRITTTGLTVLGSVTLKALLSLMMLNLLTLTTSVPALLNGLLELRIPPLLVATIASMYRYLGVLIGEFNAMRRAAACRNLMTNRYWQRLVIGNTIGSLFIRTYDRGERIHHAMLSRGYRGAFPVEKIPSAGRRDIVALALTLIVMLAGQSVYLFRQ